jgi:hypothetical protein
MDDREREDDRTPAERLLERLADRQPGDPTEISRRSLQAQRSLEGYFRASAPPRWMERVSAVDRGIEQTRKALEQRQRHLRHRFDGDEAAYVAAWRDAVANWPFDPELNVLIQQHNEWYPIERRLPMDLRTRDYVKVNGQSYRRPILDAAWALAEFPV